jgi:hypothetical protein
MRERSYDMPIGGKEGHGDACNGPTSKEVVYGMSEERRDTDGSVESWDEPR